jgi:hypothetical protein
MENIENLESKWSDERRARAGNRTPGVVFLRVILASLDPKMKDEIWSYLDGDEDAVEELIEAVGQEDGSPNWPPFTAEEISHHAYLKYRLIPDLRESGSEATADDYEFSVKMVERILDRELNRSDWITDEMREKGKLKCPHCGGDHPVGCCAQDGHGG